MSALQACPKCGLCSSNVCSGGNSRSFVSHEGNCVSFRSAGCQLPGCPGALKWEALRGALPPRCPQPLATSSTSCLPFCSEKPGGASPQALPEWRARSWKEGRLGWRSLPCARLEGYEVSCVPHAAWGMEVIKAMRFLAFHGVFGGF